MKKPYHPTWDLTTIPDAPFSSEHGRRMLARRKTPPRKVLKPCSKCGNEQTATERRKPCSKCGYRRPQWWKPEVIAGIIINLQPCAGCGEQLGTRQRRKPCPTCGKRNDDRSKSL